MTPSADLPVARDGGVATASEADPPGSRPRRPVRLRTVLALASAEASLLLRSFLVLTGLLAGSATIWILIGSARPLWWNVAWKIGFGQLVLGMAVLVAAQLAAGRPRRNAMADLYASFPASAGTRTLGQLAGLAGAAPASMLLIGAATLVVHLRGAIGAPSITVLAGGLVLVIAAGAAGIAIATRFPHPLAGMLGALVLLLSSGTSHTASGAGIWLLPWEWTQDQLSRLPGPLAGYPPAGAHVLELAGIAVLAAAAALLATTNRATARAGLMTAGILALAVICLAGVLQLRPIPTADLNHLVNEAVDPASAQRCTTANQVRYCLYPGFGPLSPSLQAPVNAVVAVLPARPARPLTVRQVLSPDLFDSTLAHGQPTRLVTAWTAELRKAPGDAATPSAINLPVGSWPAAGGSLADARFDLALSAAEWAVRLPAQAIGSPAGQVFVPCVPLGQAREAIAIWLAILSTHPPAGELQAGLPGRGYTGVQVGSIFVPTWAYPGIGASYITPAGVPQLTAAGYLLARAMTSMPQHKVSQVLAGAWARWLNWHTTDAQLAAALGIRMPSIQALVPPPAIRTAGPGPGSGSVSPLCTG